MKIDVSGLGAKLEELILREAGKAIAGPQKMDAVVAGAVEWLDAKVVFRGPLAGVLESVSDVVIRTLVGGAAQVAYDLLSKAGKV